MECRQLIRAVGGLPAEGVTFDEGLRIERCVRAMARSFYERRWVDVAEEASAEAANECL